MTLCRFLMVTLAMVMVLGVARAETEAESGSADLPRLSVARSLSATAAVYDRVETANVEIVSTLTVRAVGTPQPRTGPADIVLSIDASGSMGSGPGSKLEAAKEAASAFLELLTMGDRLGLVKFSSAASMVSPLMENKSELQAGMARISDGGGTAIGSGLREAHEVIARSERGGAVKVVILMTDGENGGGYNPIAAAELAAADGVVVFTIGFGTGLRHQTMERIAEITGGRFFAAPSAEELKLVYREIHSQLMKIAAQDISLVEVIDGPLDHVGPASFVPTADSRTASGERMLTWRRGGMLIGDSWTVSVPLGCRRGLLSASLPVPALRQSYLQYYDYRGVLQRIPIADVEVIREAIEFGVIEEAKEATP